MSTSKIFSACPSGIEASLVTVEVCLRRRGIPSFAVVGLPDTSIRESKERVMAAIRNSGLEFPSAKITVNLAPADLKKEGAEFDLPISVGILAQEGKLTEVRAQELFERYIFTGELGLDGNLRPVRGALAAAARAKEAGFKGIALPEANKEEAGLVQGLEILPFSRLSQVLHWLSGEWEPQPYIGTAAPEVKESAHPEVDLADIEGNMLAKKSLEIAASGGHNVLFIGPPGSGKTLLAKALGGILPSLGHEEMLELTKIYSAAGLLNGNTPRVTQRPFRPLHHTVSEVAVVGGGTRALPGEISLAHRGVLFLDELGEFSRPALEALRQPMEDGEILVSRAAGRFRYPARFMMAASTNPCPCGWRGSRQKECLCSPGQVVKYRRKLSGPLLDRMDLQVEVNSEEFQKSLSEGHIEERRPASGEVRQRVEKARELQNRRLGPGRLNAHMNLKEIKAYCKIAQSEQNFLVSVMRKHSLSARSYHRILKVARTIADLSASGAITAGHLSLAVKMRVLDKLDLGMEGI